MGLIDTVLPRPWHRKSYRIISALPKSSWIVTFGPIVFFLGVGSHFVFQIYKLDSFSFRGTFGSSDSPFFLGDYVNRYGYITTLLFANLPQLILSYCFFSYESLFTRMLNEKEFNSYSLGPHKELRISYPTGKRASTHWFRLPHAHGIPLLITSALLH
ncbi:hypothetical protein F4677DRAFT_434798 [Hypoxylon crocopeplum]|nr:hypothetical protein F4677DRAFT_434798 [Hypoxylon crocopeplum]